MQKEKQIENELRKLGEVLRKNEKFDSHLHENTMRGIKQLRQRDQAFFSFARYGNLLKPVLIASAALIMVSIYLMKFSPSRSPEAIPKISQDSQKPTSTFIDPSILAASVDAYSNANHADESDQLFASFFENSRQKKLSDSIQNSMLHLYR